LPCTLMKHLGKDRYKEMKKMSYILMNLGK